MTTHTMNLNYAGSRIARGILAQARGLNVLGKLARRAVVVLIPAMFIVVVASWAVSTPGMALYLQVVLWASGFLFYALALEAEHAGGAAINIGIGIAIQLLTALSTKLAPELAIVAAALAAAWIGVTLGRKV